MQTIKVEDITISAEILPNGKCVELAQPYDVQVGKYIVEVPTGFQSDFASVPRILWGIISPWGLHSGAAIVHDYLYTHHGYHDYETGRWIDATKDEADYIFLKLMLHLGVSPLRAKIMYWAVRLFGKSSWKKQGK